MEARGRIPRDRLPAIAFLVALVVAFAAYEWYARRFWFVGDEWNFLATTRLSTDMSAGEFLRVLMRPHNEHWSVLPRLWYWVADGIWGLRTYTPYVTAVILLHLGVAVLLWRLILRQGVHPWVAAGAGAVMALFGPGAENILWGFQVGFVGSALFGLAALLLADHDGADRRRDIAAAACGLGALLCSGIGIPFVVGLFVAVAFRRGLRPAVAIVAPLAVVFAAWYVAFGRANEANTVPRAGPSQWPPYIFVQATNAIEQITQFPMIGGVIIAIMVVFLGFRIRPDFRAHRNAAVYGLVATALVMSVTTAIGRASLGADQARSSRYVYLLAVMLIPLLALMLDALLRWDRRSAIPVGAFLVIAVVGSAMAIPRYAFAQGAVVSQQRDELLAAVFDPLIAKNAPDYHLPSPTLSPDVTLGELRARLAAGDLPAWTPTPAQIASARASALVSIQPAVATSSLAADRMSGSGVTISDVAGCQMVTSMRGDAHADVATSSGAPIAVRPPPAGDVSILVRFDADPRAPIPIAVDANGTSSITLGLPGRVEFVFNDPGAVVTVCGS